MKSSAPARRRPFPQSQRGVAIITALLLTTLAVTIVTSLFWQQQVQVRSMENQRLHLQTEWIVRGALDWAGLILAQDGRDTAYTAANGIWATPLAETRLDDYVERERVEGEKFDATLSGQITDAQARYNLADLADGKSTSAPQVQVFGRLLENIHLDPSLAQKVADEVARSQLASAQTDGGAQLKPPAGSGGGDGAEPMAMLRVEDLLTVAGFTPQAIEQLRDFVIVLPERLPVNVNTAPAELLAALVPGYSLSDGTTLVNNRKRIPYRDASNFTAQLGQGKTPIVGVVTKTNYFLVFSRVRLDRAALDSQALIKRDPLTFKTSLVWIREN
ncbi:type II secretion system minor pseudopilin GspK [Rugamonas sp.]|uniref:type II secretion system minor pseudopilin GspK n=1 Tax=Rugamonas sp. TaxID=1926287 RepID=UPI0025FBF969|nr:type II secretion system minor pseudopilin GspK [Rugamonas sp.]